MKILSFLFVVLVASAAFAEERVAKAIPATTRDITTQLQIFLDQQLFGPGKIDGRPGEFLSKALLRYQRAHALPETGVLDDKIPLHTVYPVYTHYTIQESDLEFIGPCPTKPEEQAKLKRLPYDSLLEFLTERYHCAPEFLEKINPTLKLNDLKPGDQVRVPNVEPFKYEELPAQGFLPAVEEYMKRVIKISRREKMLELYEGEALLAALPITPGQVGGGATETKAGTFKILGIATRPTFRWDKGVLDHGVRTETAYNLPPGPNNPVGVLWIGLNKPGIGIHGTNSPQTIGRAASHGCMRVANWDVVRLSKMITKGMSVVIE